MACLSVNGLLRLELSHPALRLARTVKICICDLKISYVRKVKHIILTDIEALFLIQVD